MEPTTEALSPIEKADGSRSCEELRGEISAATWAIHFLFEFIIGIGGADLRPVIIRKISEGGGPIPDNDWGTGVHRFTERLAKHLDR